MDLRKEPTTIIYSTSIIPNYTLNIFLLLTDKYSYQGNFFGKDGDHHREINQSYVTQFQ